MTDESGISLYAYDAFGNVSLDLTVRQGQLKYTLYGYDDDDNRIWMFYPNGRIVVTPRDGLNRIEHVVAQINGEYLPVVFDIGYRADNLVKARTYGNGIPEQRIYDLQGRLENIQWNSNLISDYAYDANSNVTGMTTAFGIKSFDYDPLDRLSMDTQPTLEPVILQYDANGNREKRTQGASVTSYGITPDTNLLSDIDSVAINHDLAGNRLSDNGGNRTFEYNNAGRLFNVYEGGSLIASYLYNALGQRVQKSTGSDTIIYYYDLDGQLISETRADGTLLKDYIWQGIEPVAQIDTDGIIETITYLHTDHLATPRLATDATGNVVWAWNSDAFGVTPADGSVTVNLRFPGQYYDSETQLHYNWNRYYDPRIGRYITSDPIGFEGGLNTFSYVRGNPLGLIDIFGLYEQISYWTGTTTVRADTNITMSVGASATVGTTTVGVDTNSSGAQWSQSTQISVGVGIDICFSVPKDSCDEEEPQSSGAPDYYFQGISKHTGLSISPDENELCIHIGPSTPWPFPGAGWNTSP